jgi:hypothetical protein
MSLETEHWIVTYDGQTFYMPNPGNQSVQTGVKSNHRVVSLIDGSKAFISPQVLSTNEAFNFEITEASATMNDYGVLKSLIDDHTKVMIRTHTGQTFTGYFDSLGKTYTLSGRNQRYIFNVSFIPED